MKSVSSQKHEIEINGHAFTVIEVLWNSGVGGIAHFCFCEKRHSNIVYPQKMKSVSSQKHEIEINGHAFTVIEVLWNSGVEGFFAKRKPLM